MIKVRTILLPLICSIISCASVPDKHERITQDNINKISFDVTQEKLIEALGAPSATIHHNKGTAIYYDFQAGHHEIPLAKFALNSQGLLIGKTWYCKSDCRTTNWNKFKQRYPASAFVKAAPDQGRKIIYGPSERVYVNPSQGMTVEVDDNEIVAIHWDKPESNYLNR